MDGAVAQDVPMEHRGLTFGGDAHSFADTYEGRKKANSHETGMSGNRRTKGRDNRDMLVLWSVFAGDSADALLDQHAKYREPAIRDVVRQYACGFGCTLLWAVAVELAPKWMVCKTRGTRPDGHNLWST